MKRLLQLILSGALLISTFGFFAMANLYAQRRPGTEKGPSVAWRPPVEANSKDYVGAQTCAGCHRDIAKQFFKTVHAEEGEAAQSAPAASGPAAAAPSGPVTVSGCEICHGPGRAHAEAEQAAAGDPAKIEAGTKLIFHFDANPKDNSARCLSCHESGKPQSSFAHSVHATAGVSCIDCHAIHPVDLADAGKPQLQTAQAQFFGVPRLNRENTWLAGPMLKQPQPGLCYSCHRTVQAQFALPEHHRVDEGFMKCTDCHNPHGTMNHFQLKKANWEACVSCHVEKRGPFVYEHAVVRVEGCTACHTPHGSVNNFLLKRREQRMLCLQCHSVVHTTPSVSGLNGQANVPHGRLGFQTSGDCTRCHAAIHGSNFDEYLLR